MFHSHPSKNKQTKKPSINSIFLPLESHSSPKDTYLCFYSDNFYKMIDTWLSLWHALEKQW